MWVGLNLTYVDCNLTEKDRKGALSQRTVLQSYERDVAIFIVYLEAVAMEHLSVTEKRMSKLTAMKSQSKGQGASEVRISFC